MAPMPVELSDPSALSQRATRCDAVDCPWGSVRRVAVLRALGLGDMVCATPALRALRHRFPNAHITLVGQAWAQAWALRIPEVDGFVAMPDHPLTREAEGGRMAAVTDGAVPETADVSAFVQTMRDLSLDLAVQMHGSGRISNAVVDQWGARHVLAFCEVLSTHEQDPCRRNLAWPRHGSEVSRLMQLVSCLDAGGSPPASLDLIHPVVEPDRAAVRELLRAQGLPPGHGRGWVCVHAGSKWASRRWPTARFAAVAKALAERGHAIVLTGTAAERALAQGIRQQVPQAIDLCGLTDLWTLGAVIEGARLLLCNDTGVSHMAAALKVPSVVISCGSDVARWAPADALRHQVLWSAPSCRPCMQMACTQTRHLCALDIEVAQVLQAVGVGLLRQR